MWVISIIGRKVGNVNGCYVLRQVDECEWFSSWLTIMFSYGTRIQWKSVSCPHTHTHHPSIHPSIHRGELVGGVVYSGGECVDSNFTQSSSNKLLLLFWLFKTLINSLHNLTHFIPFFCSREYEHDHLL